MRFLVVGKVKSEAWPRELNEMASIATEEIKYKMRLKREGKIIGGGPFLDVMGVCYILETKTIEEMGEIFFNSPANFYTDREVHPLGTFEDTLEGMSEFQPPKKSRK